MSDPAGLPALQDAIRHLHGCESTFLESVFVKEMFQDRIVREGEVQVFDLLGHPRATRPYAWSYVATSGERRFVAVLHNRIVHSPAGAVRASIMADWRKR